MDEELSGWFAEIQETLEKAYIEAPTPWEQSGKSGGFEEWTRLRIPIAECVDASGTFLDIGCANGFLLECLLDWTAKKGLTITPYGLDFAPRLVKLARTRLLDYADNIFEGNAWDWSPPMMFDYVRTEVEYVPANLRRAYINRLLADFVMSDGKLLVAQYRSRREDLTRNWIDGWLREQGFTVEGYSSGFNGDGLELTRVAIVSGSS